MALLSTRRAFRSADWTSTPTPTTPKRPKKKGKSKVEIKKEIKKEVVDKRPRSAGSFEPNLPAKRPPIGQPNVATRARGMEQVKEEELIHAGDDIEDDLPPLEQVMRPSRRK